MKRIELLNMIAIYRCKQCEIKSLLKIKITIRTITSKESCNQCGIKINIKIR